MNTYDEFEDTLSQAIQDSDFGKVQTLFLTSDPSIASECATFGIVGSARAGNVQIMDWLASKYPDAMEKCGEDALDAAFEGEHTEAIVFLTERGFE